MMQGNQCESSRMKDTFRFEDKQIDLLSILSDIDDTIFGFLKNNIVSLFDENFLTDNYYKNVNVEKESDKGTDITLTYPGKIILLSGQYSDKIAGPSFNSLRGKNRVVTNFKASIRIPNRKLPINLKLNSTAKPVFVHKPEDEVVVSFPKIADIPKGDHSYTQITKALEIIMNNSAGCGLGSDDELASQLLLRLRGAEYPADLNDVYKEYLDCLLVLMFGIETSQHNFTLLSSLMLLDLIAAKARYGNGKVFNWKCAFVSPHGYIQSDAEDNCYAGKFPMAVKRSGSGSTGNGLHSTIFEKIIYKDITQENSEKLVPHLTKGRASLLEMAKAGNRDEVVGILDTYPQRHGILKRELSLLTHWMKHLIEMGYYEKDAIRALDKFYPSYTCPKYISIILVTNRIEHMLTGKVKMHDDKTISIPQFLMPFNGEKPYSVKNPNKKPIDVINPDSEEKPFVVKHSIIDGGEKKVKYSKVAHKDLNCVLIPGYARMSHSTLYAFKGEKGLRAVSACVTTFKTEAAYSKHKVVVHCGVCTPK